ncbi:MAG: hypothetical protein ACRD8U_20660, partial [Pyrinomonadaceae bacterium]
LCLVWAGTHDLTSVATEIGARWFKSLFASLNPFQFVWRYCYVAVGIVAQYFLLLRRRIRLQHGKPLDNRHFYHFTEQSIMQTLSLFGELKDLLRVPGTNSVFAAVAVRNTVGH